MRLKRNRVQKCCHRKAVFKRDQEGSGTTVYDPATELSAEVWPAGGKVQAEMYGNKLSYIRNIRLNGTYKILNDDKGILHYVMENGADIVENDGICLYVSGECEPDYRVLSIKPHRFLRLEVEKRCQ